MLSPSILQSSFENIYISPLEVCNLNCRLCYTNKIKSILTNQQIQNFTKRYRKYINLKSILFCGGEVFLLPSFAKLVNYYTSQNIFVSIITNGTINKLSEFLHPNSIQLLVSLDGPPKIHDQNRGAGNYQKTLDFIRTGLDLGFHLEIMYLVTPDSYSYIDKLPKNLSHYFGQRIAFNYITIKTKFYTTLHSLSQAVASPGLTTSQILHLKQNYPCLPPANFGCFQLSLQSNGFIYGCCESSKPIGKLSTPIPTLIQTFKNKLSVCGSCPSMLCQGCTDPSFICGYKAELQQLSCQALAPLFHKSSSI